MGPADAVNEVAERQRPEGGRLVLDHVAWFLPDMEAAEAALTRLGFALTPLSLQMHRAAADGPLVSAGTANRCAMLERGYLEFLATTGDTPNAARLRAAMARYVGVHLVCFGTGDPAAAHARLAQRGFAPPPAVDLQREVGLSDGTVATARFAVVRAGPDAMEEGRIQFVEHRTPELLWQERWLGHPNGATGLAGVIVAAADVDAATTRWRRFTGLPLRTSAELNVLVPARGQLLIGSGAAVRTLLGRKPPTLPWIAGPIVSVADLAKTQKLLERAGAKVARRTAGRIVVDLPPELGGVIAFQQDAEV